MLLTTIECSNCGAYHDSTLKECPECHKSNEIRTLKEFPKNVFFLHPVAQIGVFAIGFAYIGMLLTSWLLFEVLPSETAAETITYVLMVIGMLSVVLLTRRKMFFESFKGKDKYTIGILFGLVTAAIGLLIVNLIPIWYKGDENVNQETIESVITLYPILGFFVFCILGPVSEELAYRVGLYSFLRRFNKYLALIMTTIVFTFIHLRLDSEDIIGELWSIPAYLLAAFAFSYVYEKKGFAASLTAHILYNIVSFVLVLING